MSLKPGIWQGCPCMEGSLYEAVKGLSVKLWHTRMLEMTETWDTCQGKLLSGNGTSPRERIMFQSKTVKGVWELKCDLTAVMEMQSLGYAQLTFSLALVQYFLIILLFPPFWNSNVCPVSLYVRSMWFAFFFVFFFFILILQEAIVKRLPWLS